MKNLVLATFLFATFATPTKVNAGQGNINTTNMQEKEFLTEYITPSRIVWMSDSSSVFIKNTNYLLSPFDGQVSVNDTRYSTLHSTPTREASILLDFGKEIQGGIQIAASIRKVEKPVKVRICLGESVTEAMSHTEDKETTATNDHAIRDFEIEIPWLGTIKVGDSGFRFARIDLIDTGVDFNLKSVQAVSSYRDIPYLGTFRSDNERLNKIWATGAYTVHLNMQNYLWDGIKRDRLVWVGDMHPEVMTINSVFGQNNVVNKSLNFARNDTPLPGWMNGMCSYSLWWIIIHHDLYLYQGDLAYLKEQHSYLKPLLHQICSHIEKGVEQLDGTRFLDWPTSENKNVIHSGLQSLVLMSIKSGEQIGKWLNDQEMINLCQKTSKQLRNHDISTYNNKQAAALKIIAGIGQDNAESCNIILQNGAENFSTFYGYYMLEALAREGKYKEAMDIISDYWGAMLDLGATTFWEDLEYKNIENAARIDEFVPKNKFDIHAGGGAYCYKGLRHSLCHGWASGPTSWLTRYVLGVTPLEGGCRKLLIEPHLGNLRFVEGTFPTPLGIVKISHHKQKDGKVISKVKAPKGIKVIIK